MIGLFHNCNATKYQQLLQEEVNANNICAHLPPMEIAVRMKEPCFISKGTSKSKKDKSGTNWASKTFHIEVAQGNKKRASCQMWKIIKFSSQVQDHTNMHLSFIPVVDKESSNDDIHYSKQSYTHQKHFSSELNGRSRSRRSLRSEQF